MLSQLRTLTARLVATVRPSHDDFDEELESHLEFAQQDLVAQGHSPREARRLARVQLGGITQLREARRERMRLPGVDSLWLDAKLGLRMLRKSWGLTLVGGLATTVAITVGVVVFWLVDSIFNPTLPFPGGDRVVALQTWDDQSARRHSTAAVDLANWAQSLDGVELFGAFRNRSTSLITEDRRASPVEVAEMTATGFQMVGLAPQLGRPLLASDQEAAAESVVVISNDVWQNRFFGDPDIIGRVVQLGSVEHSIVGVMPSQFRFPVNHHYWSPLRLEPDEALGDVDGNGVVFARLKRGVDRSLVAAQLSSLGIRSPDTADPELALRPRLVSYAFGLTGDLERGQVNWAIRLILGVVVLLLVPPCANIAILIYARTITRQEEFASRLALGASRQRIVLQVFVEVLMLASLAGLVALMLTAFAGPRLLFSERTAVLNQLPFWINFSLSWRVFAFAGALATAAAAIAGILPAIRATSGQMSSGLRGLGSRTGLKLGRTWTLLVVAQVALTLSVLPIAVEVGWGTLREGVLGPGFEAGDYLSARLWLTGSRDDDAGRFQVQREDLQRAIDSEPLLRGSAFSSSVPGDEPWAAIEIQPPVTVVDNSPVERRRTLIRHNSVDSRFLDLLDLSVLLGRPLRTQDAELESRAVLVSRALAQQLVPEGNPLGYRLRYVRSSEGRQSDTANGDRAVEPWHEIVGVVPDLPENQQGGTVIHPLRPDSESAVLLVRHQGDAADVAQRVRDLTAATNADLVLRDTVTLAEVYERQRHGNDVGATVLALVTLCVLLLSAAGIYALMSFTVRQRRREIGIRAALGAQPSRLLGAVFRRALVQIGIGAACGAGIASLLSYYLPVERAGGAEVPGIIPIAALVMLAVGALASAGPAGRGLRIDPIEELREG